MTTWVLHIERRTVQDNGRKKRTVGTYQVLHDGQPVDGLAGATAESPGPSENDHEASRRDPRRILPGRYHVKTHGGKHYATIGYRNDPTHPIPLMPGLEIMMPDKKRTDILIHPGKNEFLSSIGCINLCADLPDARQIIDFVDSRKRVIAMINDLKETAGAQFPRGNDQEIDDAWVVIEGEPLAPGAAAEMRQ